MALRLRYEIESPQRLREHVHLVGGMGYFFFSGFSSAPKGAAVALEVLFTELDQSLLLPATVWVASRSRQGGVWLELPTALDIFLSLASETRLRPLRVGSEQLVLAEGGGRPALLCRLADVSDGGVRIRASLADLGVLDDQVRIALPEAGPDGVQLEAFGRVAWAGEGEVGVIWNRGDLASRAAVRRLVQVAEAEWEGARTVAHGASCHCHGAGPRVLLLG
jgi:PilZ domain